MAAAADDDDVRDDVLEPPITIPAARGTGIALCCRWVSMPVAVGVSATGGAAVLVAAARVTVLDDWGDKAAAAYTGAAARVQGGLALLWMMQACLML